MVALAVLCVLALAIAAASTTSAGQNALARIKFFITGKDSGFSFGEIRLLWKVSDTAELENPSALFWSLDAFEKSVTAILEKFQKNGTIDDAKNQAFLSKLYAYRTKIELDAPRYKKGLESSRKIDEGQPVYVLLKNSGVYKSKVINNSPNALYIEFPAPVSAKVAAPGWDNREVSVYFWRKNDASYVFDSKIIDQAFADAKPALALEHSRELFRAQKRHSIRAECSIPALLFVLKPGAEALDQKNSANGVRCKIADISESGAAILVGGKTGKGLRIRVEFSLNGNMISMSGEVKGCDYDEEKKQSRLHIECRELNPIMKNAILAYVYNVAPESDREIFEAVRLSSGEDAEIAVPAAEAANVEAQIPRTEEAPPAEQNPAAEITVPDEIPRDIGLLERAGEEEEFDYTLDKDAE